MNDDLVTWLRVQLDENERAAREAGSDSWTLNAERDGVVADAGNLVAECFPSDMDHLEAIPRHIALHDPARVLRDVEAKRKILDEHTHIMGLRWCSTCDIPADYPNNRDYCLTVRSLALPYCDRPGYQEAWRP